LNKLKNSKILIFLKSIICNFLIILLFYANFLFYPFFLNAYQVGNNLENLNPCKLTTNCNFQSWEVENPEKSLNELIEIIKNTPRVNIIQNEGSYIHAIATSRVMKFIDDIEIKKIDGKNIFQVKSSSRKGIYDLGVNKRRIDTLHFRLIGIYN